MIRPDFPIAIDSSMRASFVECPQQAYRQYFQHLRKKGESVHLIAGGAFAKGTEVIRTEFFDRGSTFEDALTAGVLAATSAYGNYDPGTDSKGKPHPKRLERVIDGLIHYFTEFPPYTDHCQPLKLPSGKHAIEFKFAIPIEVDHPVTGEPILYVGRSDMICTYNQSLFIFDDKTTSQLGASWPDSWTLRAQLDGYVWASRKSGYDTRGAIVRGLSFLTSNFGTAESLQLRTDWQIQRWYHQLLRDVERMKRCWEEGYWDYNLSSACNAYGGCSFRDLCRVSNPEDWVETEYEVREWSPLEVIKE